MKANWIQPVFIYLKLIFTRLSVIGSESSPQPVDRYHLILHVFNRVTTLSICLGLQLFTLKGSCPRKPFSSEQIRKVVFTIMWEDLEQVACNSLSFSELKRLARWYSNSHPAFVFFNFKKFYSQTSELRKI